MEEKIMGSRKVMAAMGDDGSLGYTLLKNKTFNKRLPKC